MQIVIVYTDDFFVFDSRTEKQTFERSKANEYAWTDMPKTDKIGTTDAMTSKKKLNRISGYMNQTGGT